MTDRDQEMVMVTAATGRERSPEGHLEAEFQIETSRKTSQSFCNSHRIDINYSFLSFLPFFFSSFLSLLLSLLPLLLPRIPE